MRSIGTRLTAWYAGLATATCIGLFVAGYYLLKEHLVDGLDLLNATHLEQIRASLSPDETHLTPDQIDDRLRDTTARASSLFYVQIHGPTSNVVFSSPNLGDRRLPDMDVPGFRSATVTLEGLGEMRLGEFSLPGAIHVSVGSSMSQVYKVMEAYTQTSLVLTGLMLVISIAAGQLLSRAAMRPVRLIRETAHHIRSDNLSKRIPVVGAEDEISHLAHLLNEMFDRLELSFNQIRRFTAEASHELKTPLSLVRLQAENLLVEGGLTPAQEEAVQMQLEEIARLNKIIEELLFLSRAEAHAVRLDFHRENPRVFMQAFAQDARALAEHRGLRYADRIEGEGLVDFDPKWLRQVLFNLAQNALNFSPPGGHIFLTSGFTAESWRVAVEDQGPGVPADQRERIFERFVRLDPGGTRETKGSGLGLAISKSIIGLHHGHIRAEGTASGVGLRVVFELPLAGMAATTQPPA